MSTQPSIGHIHPSAQSPNEWSAKSRPLADHVGQTTHLHDRITPEAIPQELRDLPQWANWHGDKVIRNSRTGGNGSSTNPATWTTFTQAHKANPRQLVFIFAPDDGLVGLDVDDCRDAETGELDERVLDLLDQFPHIYWEISLSGTGLHGIGYGELPEAQSGKHPKGIGVFHHSRYFVMTGQTVSGHETMGAYGDGLASWYLDYFAPPARTVMVEAITLTLDDHDIIDALHREQNGQGIGPALLAGDNSGYPDYSTARYALANKAAFYSDDPEQVVRILRSSNLFDPANTDRERDRKAKRDAHKALSEYTGPRYAPNYSSAPYLTIVPNADADALSCADVRAELALAYAFILRQGEAIHTLRERVRRADEREAVYKNTGLGSARNVGAVLGGVLETLTPQEPDSPTPIRLYLDRLADETNQSPETCSRQLKGLATYKGPDGAPVVRAVTRKIPRKVDPATGEVTGPSKEIWVGFSCEPSELTRILASLEPDNAPQHGGATDRGVCPEHPNAGVIRRERTTKHIDHVCAHCKKVVDVETITGPTTAMHLDRVGGVPVLHDADQDDDWVPEPFAHRPHENLFPVLHHADQDAGVNLTPPPHLQHARTTDNHTSLICKMKVRGHEKKVDINGVQPPDLFEESPEPETGMDPDPEPQAEVSAKPKAEHGVSPDPSWLWDRSPEPDAPNLCACGAPLPPDRKWSCSEGCDGTPRTLGRVSA